MADRVAEQLIIKILTDIQDAMPGLEKVQKAFKDTSAAAGDMQKKFKQQYRAMGSTYDALGQHTEGVQAKMSLLRSEMLKQDTATTAGQKNIRAYAQTYKTLGKHLKDTVPQTLNFKEALAALGQKGMAQLDRISGGMVSGLKDVAGSLGLTAGAAAAAGAGIAATAMAWKFAIQPGIEFNMMLEQQSMAFKVMLGNAENSAAMMEQLKTLSLTTPIGLGEGASGTKQLIAYGFEQKEIITNLKMMTTVAKAVNVPLNDMVYVYGTLRAQGRAYTRDITQFAMRGIPIYEYLAKVLKVSRSEVKGLVEAGKVGFPEVEAALKAMTSSGGKFFGLLEESMKTTQGRLTILKNTWAMVTGEMASTSMGPLNSMLASLTQIVKESEFWVVWMKASFGLIMLMVAALLKVFAAINSIISVYTNLYKAIVRIGKEIAEWIASLGPVSFLIKNVIGPAVAWVAARFEDISRTIDKWKAKLKAFANDTKKSFQTPTMFTVDLVLGGQDAIFDKANAALKGLVAKTKGSSAFEEMRMVSAEIYDISKQTGLSAEYLTQVYAAAAGKSIEGFDALNAGINQTQNSFDIFQKRMDKFNVDDRLRRVTGLGAANLIYDNMDNSYEGMKRLTEQMVKFGMTNEEALNLVGGEAEKLKDTLFELIQTMSGDEEFRLAPAGQATIDELIKKYLALQGVKKGDDKATKDMEDTIARYMSERAEWLNTEQAETLRLLGYRVQLSDEDTAQGRAMDNITYKYELIKQRLYENKALLADSVQLQLRLAIIAEEEKEERQKALYAIKKAYLDNKAAVATSFDEQVTAAQSLYTLELEQLQMKIQGAEVQAEIDVLEFKHRKDILELYQQQYDLMNKGSAEFFKKQKKGLVDQSRLLSDASKSRDVKKSVEAASTMMKDSITIALEGTDIGALVSGSDPFTMFISALSETVLAVENVNKSLNFMKTVMEGVTAVISGPLNEAFKPVVYVLTKLGEVLGEVIMPIIDTLAWTFSSVADILMPLLQLVKMLFKAVAPLVSLFIKLMNPLQILVDALTQSLGLTYDMISLQTEQVSALEDLLDKELRSLMDLYKVGAISGAEYERRLAELRGPQEGATGGGGMNTFFTQMSGWVESIAAWCANAYNILIGPIIEALKTVWQVIGVILAPIGNMIQTLFVAFAPILSVLEDIFSVVGELIGTVVEIFAQLMNNPLTRAMIEFFSGMIFNTIVYVLNVISTFLEKIESAIAFVAGILKLIKLVFDWFVAVFSGDQDAARLIQEAMLGILKGIWDAIVGLIKGIGNVFIDAINWVLNALATVVDWLNGFKGKPNWAIPRLATGSADIPKDMLAMLHKGEMVVPKKFAQELRPALAGNGSVGSGSTNIYVNVEGSVIEERNLAQTVITKYKEMKKGGYV